MSNKNLDNLFKDVSRPTDVAWGHVGSHHSETRLSLLTTGKVCYEFNVDLIKGRKYRVMFHGSFAVHHRNLPTLIQARVRINGTHVPGAEGNLAWSGTPYDNNDIIGMVNIFGYLDWTEASAAVPMNAIISVNAVDATIEKGHLAIEDVGPI